MNFTNLPGILYGIMIDEDAIECECGHEKAGDSGEHSKWCPKHPDQMRKAIEEQLDKIEEIDWRDQPITRYGVGF